MSTRGNMTDPEFTRLLRRLSNAHKKFLLLLEEAEDEYEARYGSKPSELGDDGWIDTFHVVGGYMSAAEVRKSAISYGGEDDRC